MYLRAYVCARDRACVSTRMGACVHACAHELDYGHHGRLRFLQMPSFNAGIGYVNYFVSAYNCCHQIILLLSLKYLSFISRPIQSKYSTHSSFMRVI